MNISAVLGRWPGARQRPNFRRDINGLRALAIALVVVFHAFPNLLPGGFIGVDVFFVISGYLISGVVLHALQADTFSLVDFYKRRAIRILPALVVVLTVTMGFGWISLYSFEFERLASHATAAMAFASNFILWREAGYFDVTALQKPLMHLWSLAIEEQFYLLFPIIIWLFHRRSVGAARIILGAMTLSFVVNIVESRTDVVGDFFNPAARVWEILSGAFLAAREVTATPCRRADCALPGSCAHPRSRIADVQSLAGLGIIAASAMGLYDALRYPGWYALLPVAGALLLIAAGPAALVNRTLLANRLANGIGLISYPLYLWHWPILSYVTILQPDGRPEIVRLIAVTLAVVVAAMTFLGVERPFTRMRDARRRGAILAASTISFAMFSFVVCSCAGFPERPVAVAAINAATYAVRGTYKFGGEVSRGCDVPHDMQDAYANCEHNSTGRIRFVLLGDSKAASLAPGVLLSKSRHAGGWMFIGGPKDSGAPLPVWSDAPEFRVNQTPLRQALATIAADSNVRVVVLAAATRSFFLLHSDASLDELDASPEYPNALDGLDRVVTYLTDAGKKVVLLVDNPTLRDPMLCASRVTSVRLVNATFNLTEGISSCQITRAQQLSASAKYRRLLSEVAGRHAGSAYIFDSLDILCDEKTSICPSMLDGHHLYSYGDHISTFAAYQVAKKLIPFVESLVPER